METILRMLPLGPGKRHPVRLDAPTWQAVDWLASQAGKDWRQWCKPLIEGASPGENLTAIIRAAAMDGLLSATIFEDRGEQLAAMSEHPLMRNSGTLNDRQFEEVMTGATVQGWSDFIAFAVGFGRDEHGQDCIWVKNGLRNGLHFAFVVPEHGEGAQ